MKLSAGALFLVVAQACPESPPASPRAPGPEPEPEAALIFRSGFEEGVSLGEPVAIGSDWRQFITGADSGFDWSADLPHRDSPKNAFTYLLPSRLPFGDFVETRIESSDGRDGALTKVLLMALYREQAASIEDTRNQFALYPPETMDRAYIRMWMKLQPDLSDLLATTRGQFRMVMEWKETAGEGEDTDFRFNFNIKRGPDEGLYWLSHGQWGGRQDDPRAWDCESHVPVPLGTWFPLEVYWKLGQSDGRLWAAANGQVALDFTGRTQRDSELYVWNMFKVYLGSDIRGYVGPPIYQWLDDVELYSSAPGPLTAGSTACETFVQNAP
jgi:hypothetical protein